jgi:hypothetical protein
LTGSPRCREPGAVAPLRRSSHAQPSSRFPASFSYGWWASNGPTGGYLSALALDAIGERDQLHGWRVISVDLNILRTPVADAFEAIVSFEPGMGRTVLAVVTFTQERPVAAASIYLTADLAAESILTRRPPSVLPPEAYAVMVTPPSTSPPVTSQFAFRPIVTPEGRSGHPGLDLVWVRPAVARSGDQGIVQMVDCWYPANHMRVVRDYLDARDMELRDPPETNLLASHTLLLHPQDLGDTTNHVLLTTRLDAIVRGVHFEQWQLWSEGGQLLATAHLIRRERRV